MFSANTIMGKFCHLCLGHDYTITFPVCQGTCHHDRWGCFWHFYSNPQVVLTSSLENFSFLSLRFSENP